MAAPIKIPSCIKCNGGASKDDEYLRTMIGLSVKGERDEILKPLSDATARAYDFVGPAPSSIAERLKVVLPL